jgi:dTDP-4-dehydrorhamnose reductase
MKVLVIGKSGQLAWELAQATSDEFEIICLGRNDISITNAVSLSESLQQYRACGVINASAYTAVDDAEKDIDNAYRINAAAVGTLAQVCKTQSLPLVHISTDFVFHGEKGSPYLPGDEIKPLGVYGASKAEGEKLITEIYPENSCIIRTSWVYSTHGKNFVKTMLNLMSTKNELGIICDQIGSPTFARGLAEASLLSLKNNVKGIHHYTDLGVASWYDFALSIQSIGIELGLLSKRIPIKPINTSEYPTPAKRPHYSVLDKNSFAIALPDLKMRHWQEQLRRMMVSLKEDTI